ncbi:phosphoribosylpyrophosphate synthetase [Leptobacterium sp. I13]|uniref:phosphoribosylpyrophosphate synthetase n=1 Tax=Leptobacterium meishanense TaxID=3128904 RepID=UPI0030EC4663
MKRSYETLVEAINDLQSQGYIEDFNLHMKTKDFSEAQFNVVKFYRFEGNTYPGDNMVLYVIETNTGKKGLLLDAYGAYATSIPLEILKKLNIR